MRLIITGILPFLMLIVSCGDQTEANVALKLPSTYSEALAEECGADEYGMRKYVMAILKTGDNDTLSVEEAESLEREHMNNINRLAEEGVLQLAGPFFNSESELRGIYIFSVETLAEAKKLVESDPSIKKGVLKMELHSWFGSAALMTIPNLHKAVSKTEI